MAPSKSKIKTRYIVWFAVATALVLGLLAAILALGALAFSNAGTSLTRKDFATEASARAFVDDPAELSRASSALFRY